ncbi:unnamed protein product [Urochloa humidicola]
MCQHKRCIRVLDVNDDILLLILQKIDSPVSLVRAASTCKRWHAIIADAGFLRRFRSVHASPLVAGDYFNDSMLLPGLNELGPRLKNLPSFVPAASSSIDARHFSLDFLSAIDEDKNSPSTWTVFDSRGSLLLLTRTACGECSYSGYGFRDIVVCEPSTRRYKRITPPPYFNEHYYYKGSYLVDGDADVAGGRIGMSNFRVIWMFIHYDVAERASYTGTAMFVAGNRGTSCSCTDPKITLGSWSDLGRAGGSWYFYTEGRNLVVLDGSTGKLSHSVLPPPSKNWVDDFDLHIWGSKFYVADGRDGKPRIFTVFDETMKVYARLDGGEWALEKRLPAEGNPGPARI